MIHVRLLVASALGIALQACSHTADFPKGFTVRDRVNGPQDLIVHEITPAAKERSSRQNRRPASDEELTKAQRKSRLRGMKGFYDNASAGFIPAIRMLDGAVKSIDIEIYEMEDLGFRRSLRAALDRGVQIRIIKDPAPVGNPLACPWFKELTDLTRFDCVELRDLIAAIRAKGGSVVPFVKAELCDQDLQASGEKRKTHCYQHGKLIIADGVRALISTGNFNASSLCNLEYKPSKCNRDFSFVTANAAEIAKLRGIFEHDLKQVRSDLAPIVLQTKPWTVTASPYSAAPLLDFIRSAKKSIQIQNQYLKDETMNQALFAAAAKPGMKVEVIVGSLCSFARPHPSQYEAAAELFRPFEDAEVQVRMFTPRMKVGGRPGYLHSKAILIDGETADARAWIGSVNGSTGALNVNREFGIFFQDRRSVKKLAAVMRADFDHVDSETWEESFVCLKDSAAKPAPAVMPGEPAVDVAVDEPETLEN